ncbi:OmpL47-type beta-barrel domain-containing protein [Bacillus sp. V5-8f]|uniref:OmpL47-type beta-barrel domain-containing protein n=1 Tax=Bacillus sp. V5-8f TaxID=2053044 RepID=UPI000C75822B|nr:hypothetical protein [Bacillus sp. V5-8f]PLT32610.1 hypothetical protein CUU64_18240 [Bacillus sp. V5-8f]
MVRRIISSTLIFAILIYQLIVPIGSAWAATDNSILPPSNFAFQKTAPEDVKLTWSSVYGATGYVVYEITEGQLVKLGSTTTASYSLNDLAEGTYSYVVSTLNGENESGPCAPINIEVAYPDLAAPTLTYTIQNGNDIVLSWTASQYAQKYNLYKVASDGEKSLVTTSTARTYTVVDAPEGKYTYAVSAVNTLYGQSPLSESLVVDVVHPEMEKPSNLTFTIANGNDVTLKWQAVNYATGYKVYQIVNGQEELKSTVNTTTAKLTNVPSGEYVYKIYSSSSRFGDSAEGSEISVNVSQVTMAPPSNVTFKLQNLTDVVLTWGAVPNATGYNVYQIVDGEKVLKSTLTGTTVTYKNHAAGDFVYEVHSYSDRFGESEQGGQVPVKVDAVTMAAPEGATYKIQNGNDIVLNWGTVPNATEYKVYQIMDGQKVLKSTLTGTTVTYANMTAGDYQFLVHSSSTRFGESQEGSQISMTLNSITMSAPEEVTYSLQNINDVVLNWTTVPYATSYKVYEVVDGQRILKSALSGTTVTYTNLSGGNHIFEVYSYSTRFGESKEGKQVSVQVDSVAMDPPANVAYNIQNGNDIVLIWTSVQSANNYKIYQITNGQKVLKSTVTGTTVTYANLPERDYEYEVYANSTRFGESKEGKRVAISLSFPEMKAPVNVIQTIKSGTEFSLSWEAADYATSYKVYQIVNGQKNLKSTVTGKTVNYSNMLPGKYTYEIHSYSARFGESNEGTRIEVTLNGQTMQAPENLAFTITNGNDINLKWTAAQDATSYKIYQVIDGEKVFQKTVTTTAASFANMPAGDLVYVVHSISPFYGESPEGAEVNIPLVHPIIGDPANLGYKIQNGNDIVLTWSAVQYANSYKVYELVGDEEVLKSTITGLTTTLSNVMAGNHPYIVRAVSTRFGESPQGSKLSVLVDNIIMGAPANLIHTITNGNDVTLKWDPITYAKSYKIYQVIDGEKVWKSTVTGSSTVFSNLPQGDYEYEVHSFSDRYGESPEGSNVSFNLTFPVMQAPGNLVHTIADGNDLTLKWNPVTYATSYKVYQIIDGEKELIRTQTGTSLALPNMSEDDYTYEVHSVSSRFGESPEASKVSFELIHPIMQAPANPTYAIANGNDITLRWASSTYATGYNIYQIVGGEKKLQKTVTGTAVSFTNMPEGEYKYEIYSVSSRFGESPSGSELKFTMTWPVVQSPVVTGTVFNANNMTLSWKSTAWANEYRVYKIKNDNRELIYKGAALTHKVYNLTEDTHSFEVAAYNTRFGESASSNLITEKIVYPEMQPPVASLQLLSETSARISWNFITYANGYNIYEIIGGKPVLVVKNVNNLSYTIENLTYANHEYYVTSYSNSFGESDPSNMVLAKLIIDTEAPVTKSNAKEEWTNAAQEIKLEATDNEVGVDKTYNSLNGSPFVEGTSVSVEEEGVNKLSFYSVDKVGNKEQAKTVEVKIDKTAPATESNAPQNWSKEEVTVTLTAKDTHSGVAQTFYSVNGSDYQEGTSFTVEKEGINQVSYYSVDEAGNKEDVKTAQVKIDKTVPNTESNAPQNWSKEDVPVTLTTSDTHSGVAQTFYSVNGSDYKEGTSFTVEKEGVNQITYYSVDEVGNKEEVKTVEVKIDKTVPSTESNAPQNWSKEEVTVTLTAKDAHSGVAQTFYSVNGSDYQEGTSFTVEKEGVNQISYYSVDEVGNKEDIKTAEVKIDKTVPETESNAPQKWSKEDVTVILTANDTHSGVAQTFYSVNGSDYQEGTSFTVEKEGVNQIAYYSMDEAGNKEEVKTSEVKIDKTSPSITMDTKEYYLLGDTIPLLYSAKDNMSGVVDEEMLVLDPNETVGKVMQKDSAITFTQPGLYNIMITATDAAGNTTEIKKQLNVYIPATIEVTPKVINGNKGVFTVRVDVPSAYRGKLELDHATLNGVKALNSNNGYYNQAKQGQFKFERSDFTWTNPEVTVEFRGKIGNIVVIGQTTVQVKK